METKPTTETRTCDTCGKQYEHEPFSFQPGGVDMFANCYTCPSCSEEAEKETAEQNRIGAAKAEFERIVPPSYCKTDINHQGFNVALWDKLKNWRAEHGWLGLVGETGRCKSRCLALLVKRLCWEGWHGEWCTATGFQWAARRQFHDQDGNRACSYLDDWKKARVLVLDDLGKQTWTPTVESEFYDLLEYRTNREKLTLWSANTHPEEMVSSKQLSQDRGAPIVGRLLDYSEIILV